MNWKWKLAQAAEIRWWRSYLSKTAPADYLRNKRSYWKRVMKEAGIEVAPKVRVLDAGCGPAGIFLVLNDQRVDAVDPLIEQYELHLPHFAPKRHPNVRFIPVSLEQYRNSRAYDEVFCLNAINHVADIRLALDHLIECLDREGRLWLSIDVHRYRGLNHLFRLIPADILHPHQYTLQGYEELLQDRGLTIRKRVKLKPGYIFDYYLIEARFA